MFCRGSQIYLTLVLDLPLNSSTTGLADILRIIINNDNRAIEQLGVALVAKTTK